VELSSRVRPTTDVHHLRPAQAELAPAGCAPDSSTASHRLGPPCSSCPCSRRLRYRASVDKASPCFRQNSSRLIPPALYSTANCAASARLRRRRGRPACSSLILPVQHRPRRVNRWVALTLTE
jgi:hypothetical protein